MRVKYRDKIYSGTEARRVLQAYVITVSLLTLWVWRQYTWVYSSVLPDNSMALFIAAGATTIAVQPKSLILALCIFTEMIRLLVHLS